jgi:hypothetical protein
MKPNKQDMRSASLPVIFVGRSCADKEEAELGRAMCRRDSAPTLPRSGRREELHSSDAADELKEKFLEGSEESLEVGQAVSSVRQSTDASFQKVAHRRQSMRWPTVPPVQRLGIAVENLGGIRHCRFNLEVSTDILLDTLSISLVLPFGAVLAMSAKWAEIFLCAMFGGLI